MIGEIVDGDRKKKIKLCFLLTVSILFSPLRQSENGYCLLFTDYINIKLVFHFVIILYSLQIVPFHFNFIVEITFNWEPESYCNVNSLFIQFILFNFIFYLFVYRQPFSSLFLNDFPWHLYCNDPWYNLVL